MSDDALEVLAKGSKSFDLAARFLPPRRRTDAAVVYAFCRRADDLADDRVSDEAGRQSLALLRDSVESRTASEPWVAAFLDVSEARGIQHRYALDLLDGLASDIGPVRVEDDRELHRYCYRVAGAVGLLMCPVIGVEHGAALPFAVDLGLAMQLTNICRDVAEDAARDRVYLPRSRLRDVGIDPEDLVAGRPVDRGKLAIVVRALLARAERLYASADRGMHFIPWAPRAAIIVASRVYREIGRQLLRRGADPLAGRTVVSRGRKMWVATMALTELFSPPVLGLAGTGRDPSLHRHLRGLFDEAVARRSVDGA